MTACAQLEEETVDDDFADFGGVNTSNWSFRSGALFLNSGRLSDTPLITRTDFSSVLNGDAINIGYGAGWEFEFEKRLNENWCLSGRYFQVDSFNDELIATGVADSLGVLYRRNTVAGLIGNFPKNYRLVYGADLSTAELLAKRQILDWLNISAGVRYLKFDDAISFTISGFSLTSRNNLSASNDLTGFQLGSEIRLWQWNRLELFAEALAGVYQNQSSNELQFTSSISNTTLTSGISSTRTSFVGEFDVTGRYRLRDHISIEGGYRFLWLDGIAMANEQSSINRSPGSGFPADRINNSSELFVHGATVRLIIDF